MPRDPAAVLRRPFVPILGAFVLVILGSRHAASEVKGAPAASDPMAQLNQRLDALTQRVKQLELGQINFQKSLSKPDVPDDAAESTKKMLSSPADSSPKGSSGSAGTASSGKASDPAKDPPPPASPPSQGPNLQSITQRLTALENRHSITAPFNVTDAAGKLIFRVEDSGNGGGRGAYVFNAQAHLVAAAYDSGAGGHVDVMSGSDSGLRARLDGQGPAVSLVNESATLAELVAATPDEIELNLNPNGVLSSGFHAGDQQSSLFLRGSATETFLINEATDAWLQFGPKNDPTVTLNSDATGGSVRVGKAGAAGNTYTRMAASKDGLGLIVKNSGTAMDYMGIGNDGNNGLVAVYGGGKMVAALQTYNSGKGQISVFNSAGLPIAFLAESDKHPGGGNMTASDPSGNGVFSAGFTGGSGGDACLNLKSTVLKCLGIGLPLGN